MTSASLLTIAGLVWATAVAAQHPPDSRDRVKALHGTLIKPASDIVFSIGRAAPATREEWSAVSRAGAALESAGKLMLESRIDGEVKWARLSRDLAQIGRAARRAGSGRNTLALTQASDRLIVVCETCHAAYRQKSDERAEEPAWSRGPSAVTHVQY